MPLGQRLSDELGADAADHLMRTIGLARVTTKEIAREAGCSEAARTVLEQAALFYESGMTIAGGLLAEPTLLERHRQGLETLNIGPHLPIERLAEYLSAAVAARVLPAAAAPRAAAMMLMGACFQRAFLARFSPPAPPPEPAGAFAAALVTTFLATSA